MSILGCCLRPNGFFQTTINAAQVNIRNIWQTVHDKARNCCIRIQQAPQAYRQRLDAAHERFDQHLVRIEEQQKNTLRQAQYLKMTALVCGCLSLACFTTTIGSFITLAPLAIASISLISSVAFAILSHDFMQIAKSIKKYFDTMSFTTNVIFNPNYRVWHSEAIYENALIVDRVFFGIMVDFIKATRR